MTKRKCGPESMDTIASRLTQNNLLKSTILDSSLSSFASYQSTTLKPLSLENTLLSENRMKTQKISTGISSVIPVSPKLTSSEDRLRKSTNVATSFATSPEDQEAVQQTTLALDTWSELASINDIEEFSSEATESLVPVDTDSVYGRKFVDDKLSGTIDDARTTKVIMLVFMTYAWLQMNLLQFIASSLVDGGLLKRAEGRLELVNYLQVLSARDPEFILKVILFPRHHSS
ncbi:hypothetical protein FBUS_06976 [Fasciolopsis buskii]|uniref:Uncharacterized protein n=1 Tax=Fasciolopsis buskii TaxID=27845 RepID=A0A8E0S3S4_9TREM|nr:hypothetical protein FBUS_06976 [Fasciolopsis buski]